MRKETKMSKKLKIQFWKAEKALAMQILEQEGLPKEKRDGFIKIIDSPALDFVMGVWLRGYHHDADFNLETIHLESNAERDAYLDKVVNAITEELFTGKGEIKVGKICEVRDSEISPWVERKLLVILPKKYDHRFITDSSVDANSVQLWVYARPLSKRSVPTVEKFGSVITYTWEEK